MSVQAKKKNKKGYRARLKGSADSAPGVPAVFAKKWEAERLCRTVTLATGRTTQIVDEKTGRVVGEIHPTTEETSTLPVRKEEPSSPSCIDTSTTNS